ncbi:hypothetical protein TNIN_105321 [Trichonephila inaurata madagascariensis]|uniref:Uncharacterized protein n=1 Tax=Trichonephila inaurata madagascariensis TaxID=2747483 RepID=A0A8X7C0K4_9ARAC|nr:hypothetical protein TNIN_105321 [Trichonephila inaurata madagascariensis]
MKLFFVCLLSLTLMTLSHGWAIAVSCYRLGPDGQIHCTRAIDPNGFSAAAAAAVTGNGQVARPPAPYGLGPEGSKLNSFTV